MPRTVGTPNTHEDPESGRACGAELARISPLHPDSTQVLLRLAIARALLGHRPVEECTPKEARSNYRQLLESSKVSVPELPRVENLSCPGPGGDIGLRYYQPRECTPAEHLPVMLFLHGGGGVIGDLETHDGLCRALADAGGFSVIAVDYRLAPEHPFPAAIEDAESALAWAIYGDHELPIDRKRVVVAGDSFGANLAAVLCLIAKDRGLALAGQLLMCPSFGFGSAKELAPEFQDGPLLTRAAQAWFNEQYLAGRAATSDWRLCAPVASDHEDLPPAFILTAGADPLQPEGAEYAEQLSAAGNIAIHRCYPGMLHGFMMMGPKVRSAETALAEVAEFAAVVLARPTRGSEFRTPWPTGYGPLPRAESSLAG